MKRKKKKIKKHPGGRPTKYSKEVLKDARRYIRSCRDGLRKVLESTNSKTGRKRFRYEIAVRLPKAEGLALALKISRDTLYEWAKKQKEFSDILEEINQIQADRVINKALAGEYNPMIAKLLLGKHGYKDEAKVEVEDKRVILDE
jgi:hypothetical protein